MALRKALRRKSGVTAVKGGAVQIPVNPEDLVDAIHQLQESHNELIVRHNALCDDTTHAADKVTGAAQADSGLFTPLP